MAMPSWEERRALAVHSVASYARSRGLLRIPEHARAQATDEEVAEAYVGRHAAQALMVDAAYWARANYLAQAEIVEQLADIAANPGAACALSQADYDRVGLEQARRMEILLAITDYNNRVQVRNYSNLRKSDLVEICMQHGITVEHDKPPNDENDEAEVSEEGVGGAGAAAAAAAAAGDEAPPLVSPRVEMVEEG